MTLRRKGSLSTVWVLVVAGILLSFGLSFGTDGSQTICSITAEEINQALAGSNVSIPFLTAMELQDFIESDVGRCVCNILEQLEFDDSDFGDSSEQELINELIACIPEVEPVTDPNFSLSLRADRATVDESSGLVEVVLRADVPVSSNYTVTFSSRADGTATLGTDYTGPTRRTLTLGEGETSGSTGVTILDDSLIEADETIIIAASISRLGEDRETTVFIAEESATIVIADNDEPAFTVEVDKDEIDEEGGTARVEVNTGGAEFDENEEITLIVAAESTAAETDYRIEEQTLTLLAGESVVSTTVRATPDRTREGSETIVITAQFEGEMVDQPQTITIIDDDMPQFTVEADEDEIDEEGGTARVEVNTGGAEFDENETITLIVAAESTAAETDYRIEEQTLTLLAGESVVSTTVRATPDRTREGSETIVITAQFEGAMVGRPQTITIIDDDMPQFTVEVDEEEIDEEGGTARVEVNTGGAEFDENQTITLIVAAESTAAETDYRIEEQTLTLLAGESVVRTTVRTTPDETQEGSETIVITAQFEGEMVGQPQTITIIDDDEVSPTLSVDVTAIDEDEGVATVTVSTAGGRFDTPQTVAIMIEGGTATHGTDYEIAEQTLTLPEGETSVSTTVTARSDTAQEGDETIVIAARLAGVAIIGTHTITIMEAEPAHPTREVVEETLEAVVTSTISNVTTNIGTRFSSARGGTAVTVAGHTIPFAGSALALASLDRHSHSGLDSWDDSERRGREMTLNRLLQTSAFQVALAANGDESQQVQPLQSLTVWGRVDRMYFDKDSNDADRYDGELSAGYLGLDAWLDERWLLGVAASVNSVKADYGLDGGGVLKLTMVGLHPYLRLAIDDLSEVWGILGLSLGDIRNTSPGESESEDSDVTMYMGAAGVRRALATIGGIDLALLGDAGYGSLETGGRSGLQVVDNLSADSWRARLGFSASYTVELEALATFTPFLEIVGRYDGGGESNSGLEIAGGIQYANPVSGLGFEVRAFVLPVYSDEDYREHGFSLSASASPGIGGEGLAMLVAASMGPDTGSADALLRRKVFEPLDPANSLAEALSVNTEVGYGFRVLGSRSVLTPFGGLGLFDDGTRRLRTGMRWSRMASSAPWNLELSGEERGSDFRDTEYLVSLLGRVRF